MDHPWGAVLMWARAELRSRWAGIAVVGILAGGTGGLALGCLVGAERTATVLDRLNEATNASDAVVFPSNVGVTDPKWTTLEKRPEVAELSRWALVFGDLPGEEEEDELLFAPVGDEWMQEVDRPVVVEGRMFDPTSDGELVVAEGAATILDLHVGDTLPFIPFTWTDYEAEDGGPPTGPEITIEVVGIVRTPLEALFVDDGFTIVSPGIMANHPDVAFLENAVVQLDPEHGDVLTLQQHVDHDVADGTPVLDLQAIQRRVTTTTDVERTVLLILAAAILLVGLALVGQVVARSAAGLADDAHALRAMGLSRRAIATGSALAHAPALAVAALTSAAACLATAVVLPFGLAGRLEPHTGLGVDVAPLAVGTVALVVLLAAGTFASGWFAAATPVNGVPPSADGFVTWIRRHASVAVGIGTTMALRRTGGRNGVPVRPAIAGAVVGVLGIAAAITVDAGLRDAVGHPERAGVAWDAQVLIDADPGAEADVPSDLAAAVLELEAIDEAVQLDHTATAIGSVGVQTYAVRDVGAGRDIDLVTLEGRGPRTPGEVAIGPHTADELGLGIGDTVPVGPDAVPLRIVGLALFPADVHAEFDEGLWLDPADLDAVSPSTERSVVVRFVDDVSPEEGLVAVDAAAGPAGGVTIPAAVPPELENLEDVLPLPRWLAAFLAALAIAAALHVLMASTRARRRDFAILRTLGMTRWGTRLVLNVQGLALFAVGLAAGLPLGVAAGRLAWRLIASSVPLDAITPFAALALALLVPAALVVSQVVATGPGRRLRRLHPAEVLRSE